MSIVRNPFSLESPVKNTARILLYTILFVSFFHYLQSLIFMAKSSQFLDFNIYYVFTDIVSSGMNPFDPNIEISLGGAQQIANYPPLFYILMKPFTYLPFHTAALVWLGLNQLFLLVSGYIFFRLYPKRFSLLTISGLLFIITSFYPLFDNNSLGQANVLLLFLLTLSFFTLIKGKTLLTAIILALVIHVKIQFALFLPVLFLVGKRKLSVKTALIHILGWAISWLILGSAQNIGYFRYILKFPQELILWTGNISISANVTRLLGASSFSMFLIALIYLVLAYKFYKVLPRNCPSNQLQYVWNLTLLAILLFSPLLEIHHLTLCLLPITYLVTQGFPKNNFYLPLAVASILILSNNTLLNPSPLASSGFLTLPIALRLFGLFGLMWLLIEYNFNKKRALLSLKRKI